MAITYAAQAGTTITTFAALFTPLPDQSQQTGNNTVVVTDTLSNAGNGQIGDGTNGIGDSYVGRIVIVDLGQVTQQIRRVTAEAAGTGTTYILTVHEDWDNNPTSSDTFAVCYEYADIEDGGASGGISLGSKTGLWELSNTLTIGDGTVAAGLQGLAGQALEVNDDGNNIAFYILNNGYYFLGYESNSTAVNGGIVTGYNNVQGEPWIQFASGSKGYIYDSVLWCQLQPLQLEIANGANVTLHDSKIISGTDELHLFDATIHNCAISGRASTTEYVRVDSGTSIDGLNVTNTYGMMTADGDTAFSITTIKNVTFVNNTYDIHVNSNKWWYLENPTWGATASGYTNINFLTGTNNRVGERYTLDAVVKSSSGTTLSGAQCIIIESLNTGGYTSNADFTGSDGVINMSWVYTLFTQSTATQYGNYDFRVDKWLYTPFFTPLVDNEPYDSPVILLLDTNISETNQNTALTAGSGIAWHWRTDDLAPSSIIEYTAGTGSLTAGMIIQGASSTASGIVTEVMEGNSTAGTVHLNSRDSTNFSSGETVSRVGGTAGTWSATYTAATQQDFSVWIDGNNKSLQVIYDALAAESPTGDTIQSYSIHEWGRDQQARALYIGANGFYTERCYGEGIIIANFGAGIVSYFTDDDGNTYTPYVGIQLTISANVTLVGAEVRIYDYEGGPPDFGTELDGVESHTAPTFTFESTAGNLIYIQILKSGYEEFGQAYTMPSSSGNFFANLKVDTNI